MPAIDPPIIVTGGGGDGLTPSGDSARNTIQVECDPEDSTRPKKFKTKINRDAEITGVLIEFPDMPGQRPIAITGYEIYKIKITFNTASGSKRVRPKPPAKRKKGKKATTKRPAPRKGK